MARLSSSVRTLAPHSATAHALESRMSYGQRRKSMPMELLRASNSGVGPAPKRPPHSLCDVFAAWADEEAGAGASAMVMSGFEKRRQATASSSAGSSALSVAGAGAAGAAAPALAAASS